jgi:lipopolysaccharide transport system ATP-binding protein
MYYNFFTFVVFYKFMSINSDNMGGEIAISLKNISKCFKRYDKPIDKLKEVLFSKGNYFNDFWALQDVNLEIPRGKAVGIVGVNGSGKSTLLQIIAGTLTPTTGEVEVKGRVSALLELGSGFNPEFTGRQNVFFNARLLGLNQSETENRFDEIAKFADIGDFIDQPVKTYSSGMFVRLAFAVAVNVNPDILIVDEALSVGDIFFQHRCIRQIRKLIDLGVTTLFVSHDSSTIKTLCDSAIIMNSGKILNTGLPSLIIKEYSKLAIDLELGFPSTEQSLHQEEQNNLIVAEKNEEHLDISARKDHKMTRVADQEFAKTFRRGSGKAKIEEFQLFDHLGLSITKSPIIEFNQEVILSIRARVYESIQGCIFGFFVCDKNGTEIIGTNTHEENIKIEQLGQNQELEARFKFKLPLRPNSYSITVALAESYESVTLDWIDNAIVFQVLPPKTSKRITALVDIDMEVNVIKLV